MSKEANFYEVTFLHRLEPLTWSERKNMYFIKGAVYWYMGHGARRHKVYMNFVSFFGMAEKWPDLVKHQLVAVRGRIDMRRWTDKVTGGNRVSHVLLVHEMIAGNRPPWRGTWKDMVDLVRDAGEAPSAEDWKTLRDMVLPAEEQVAELHKSIHGPWVGADEVKAEAPAPGVPRITLRENFNMDRVKDDE